MYVHPCHTYYMNTTGAHTHRFEDGTCTRCGAAYAEVVAARQAKAAQVTTPQAKARQDMDAVAALNDRRDAKARREDYYRRTGR